MQPLIFTLLTALLAFVPAAVANPLDDLIAMPENQIDIGMSALIMATEFYPKLDVAAYSQKIDDLANQVRIMNTVLFKQEGYHYDRDPFARSKQDYYFLNGILDTKQGTCYIMPLLYVAVAQRVGYPIYPVAAPDHLFVRYVKPNLEEFNIEITSGGKHFTDESYIEDFAVSPQGIKSGAYMHTMSYREFFANIIAASAFTHAREGYGYRAMSYYEKAIKLDPHYADAYDNLALGYAKLSEMTTGEKSAQYLEKSKQYSAKAKELGYVNPEEIDAKRKIRGNQ